ncbi:unnamed protein product, partial [Scytosiphon promiscuus]
LLLCTRPSYTRKTLPSHLFGKQQASRVYPSAPTTVTAVLLPSWFRTAQAASNSPHPSQQVQVCSGRPTTSTGHMPTQSSTAVAFVAVLAGMMSSTVTTTEALEVTSPSVGMTVVAQSPYIVSWEGASPDDRFEIDLHYSSCGSYSYCFDEVGDCGSWVAS